MLGVVLNVLQATLPLSINNHFQLFAFAGRDRDPRLPAGRADRIPGRLRAHVVAPPPQEPSEPVAEAAPA